MSGVNNFDIQTLNGSLYAEMIHAGAANLRANAEEVNELNVFPVPDGDTGDNMSMTAEGGTSALRKSEAEVLDDVAAVAARGMLLGARGNSGVILSQFFAGMARAFEKYEEADINTICSGLALGVKQAYAAVMKPTEGTILTVAREGVENTVSAVDETWTVGMVFEHLLREMKLSLDRTPDILPVLKEAGVVDSGGAGIVYIFEGFLKAIKGEKVEAIAPPRAVGSDIDLTAFGPDSVMTYGYCTELLLQLQSSKVDPEAFDPAVITEFLMGIGDSIVSFKTGTIVKIHVHTLTPEKVLEFCRSFGEFLTIKIENMSVQHSEALPEKKEEKPATPVKKARTKFGYVAVASGSGIERLFLDLGVNYVVDGGQTKNPSTSDFLEAFEETNADHIFVFPNNGNILLAASQAAEIYKDSTIHVIPSKDIGMGYVALSTLDMSSEDPDQIEASLIEAMENVTTGSVSPAVRDAELNGVKIKNGEFIGFVGKQMLVSKPKMVDSACGLIDSMLEGDDKFMLTVFCGRDATENDAAEVEAYVTETYPDVEVYLAEGAQDVYPFIFVAEG